MSLTAAFSENRDGTKIEPYMQVEVFKSMCKIAYVYFSGKNQVHDEVNDIIYIIQARWAGQRHFSKADHILSISNCLRFVHFGGVQQRNSINIRFHHLEKSDLISV